MFLENVGSFVFPVCLGVDEELGRSEDYYIGRDIFFIFFQELFWLIFVFSRFGFSFILKINLFLLLKGSQTPLSNRSRKT